MYYIILCIIMYYNLTPELSEWPVCCAHRRTIRWKEYLRKFSVGLPGRLGVQCPSSPLQALSAQRFWSHSTYLRYTNSFIIIIIIIFEWKSVL